MHNPSDNNIQKTFVHFFTPGLGKMHTLQRHVFSFLVLTSGKDSGRTEASEMRLAQSHHLPIMTLVHN
jgi:hypothetical protein